MPTDETNPTAGISAAIVDPREPHVVAAIEQLIETAGIAREGLRARIITQVIQDALKLGSPEYDGGQIKLIGRAFREMRYAYRVFNRYRGTRKISIFGSARTPEAHPDYQAAKTFSAAMAASQWMCITGAGDGIMKAGHEGPQRESSFGLSIRLPFETTANTVIEGDPKLINFRYFFTRKLMFMSHADAVAVFPGGFGTQDELFEALTLVQTGKSNLIPILMLEGAGGSYWQHWDRYVKENLLASGWISPEDPMVYYIARTPEDAVDHVLRFYRLYHSSRYVGDKFVIRLRHPLTPAQLEQINQEFAPLVKSGRIELGGAQPGEEDHLELPRLVFEHTRRQFGLVRIMIDRINSLPAEGLDSLHPGG